MNQVSRNVSFVKETYGEVVHNQYIITKSENYSYIKSSTTNGKNWLSLNSFFMSVFLPHGFPDSVSKDYIQYQIWDSIQAFASSITGSICTHAVLKGAGVGDENASPLAATLTWLYKDGVSMIGRIVFAWSQGTRLDCDCKKWRLFADVLNDLALFMDLLSSYFQNHFMLIICVSGLMKSLVGVAGGSTRAALTQHQARKNNMADVSAKDGSQETLVNLIALICSLVLVPVITKSFMLTWFTYISMTIIHIIANYCAVKCVSMEMFNIARFRIFASQYFSVLSENSQKSLSVDMVNKEENVFFSLWPEKACIKMGVSFEELDKKRHNEVTNILQLYEKCDYLLYLSDKSLSKVVINIALRHGSTVSTQMEALYQACYLLHLLDEHQLNLNEKSLMHYETSSRDYAKKTFTTFINCAKRNGFNTDSALFESDIWRLDWFYEQTVL